MSNILLLCKYTNPKYILGM